MFLHHYEELISRYQKKGMAIDSNLLLLMMVGAYNVRRISTFKRTMKYTEDDYGLLLEILARFDKRMVTPNIMTEVDNMLRQMPESEHEPVGQVVSDVIKGYFETYYDSASLTSGILYSRIGLTDSTLLGLSADYLILTDDFPLANRLEAMERGVINLNHLRQLL